MTKGAQNMFNWLVIDWVGSVIWETTHLKDSEQGFYVEPSDAERFSDGSQAKDDSQDDQEGREADVKEEREESGRRQHLDEGEVIWEMGGAVFFVPSVTFLVTFLMKFFAFLLPGNYP